MNAEKPYSNLLLIDAHHVDYFFYFLCHNYQKEKEKLQSAAEFEKSDKTLKLDLDLIKLRIAIKVPLSLSEIISSFDEEMSQQLEDIRFKTEINLYKYRSKCEFDKLDLKFADINPLNDPFEGGYYHTNKTLYFP